MTDNNETSSINSPSTISSANKDLSCLRCRKKKAKCSKTRPTCTRCLRSNQSCEYPDAPPNLSDLSQKVLTLYDSLRELEGEFLVKYMQNMEQEPEPVSEPEEEIEIQEEIGIEEVGGWSMSFGPSGLCLQAVTRNWHEYHRFVQSLSRQMARDFGEDCLPTQWDLETDEEGEELEEDVYLVTVPVSSLQSLLLTEPVRTVQYRTYGMMPVFVEMHKAHMTEHLQQRYQHLEGQHQLVLVMLYLKPFLVSCSSLDTSDSFSDLYIMTAYIGSLCLFPPLAHLSLPPLSDFVWKECMSDLSLRLVDVVLSQPVVPVPALCCLLILAWYHLEINKTKNDLWIQLALRVAYGRPELKSFLPLLAYLDAYSALVQSRRPLFPYEETKQVQGEHGIEEGVLCEARLMPLLDKVISLFYQFEGSIEERKVDVDEVLELVKKVEQWENELPQWARWESEEKEKKSAKMQMHMVYNIVKILLFRPFTTLDEQTHTKTTFLDMSTASANRLSVCLGYSSQDTHWTEAGHQLIQDVVNRLKGAFDQDEEIVQQIELILNKA